MTAWTRIGGLLALGCALSFGWVAQAAPLDRNDLPNALKDWVHWALQGKRGQLCPVQHNDGNERHCVWPSRLEIRAGAGGASFRFEVAVFGEPARVELPGEPGYWPQDLKAGGKPLAAVEVDGRPQALLAPGRHLIEGQIPWRAMPQDLLLPQGIGALQLQLDGQTLPRVPNGDGRVWLRHDPQQQEKSADGASLRTVRLLDDQIPLRLTTHFELTVAGKPREIVLPLALLPGWIAESVESPLPVRLQDDGRLIVQARPGRWTLQIGGRQMSPRQDLTLPASAAAATAEATDAVEGIGADEVWAFAAHNELRLVSIDGATAVDPKQVEMPEAWRRHPAYRLRPGETLRFAESRRGNPAPDPDALAIARELWLDFDGGGFTVRDRITGKLSRSTRLEMQAPGVLGRASVAEQDQTITRLNEQGRAGVELRNGAALLGADSRIEGALRELPASGWNADFDAANATLRLPPGWLLLHAGGVDAAEGSWVARWTLWDFFFVLLGSLAAGRLLGWRSGALLGIALALTWHRPGAPSNLLWLALLATLALARLLPEGRAQRWARLGWRASAALVALALLPYAVNQIRLSLYPSLERPFALGAATRADTATAESMMAKKDRIAEEEPMAAPAPAAERMAPPSPDMKMVAPEVQVTASARNPYGSGGLIGKRLDEPDPRARVQTGPGLPTWNWHEYRLQWQGPVQRDQLLRLWLLPPWATALLRLGGLALLIAALWRLAELPSPLRRLRGGAGTAAALLAATLVLGTPDEARAADGIAMPTDQQLEALRGALNPPPACLPHCAEVPRAWLTAAGTKIQLRLELHAQADVALPLPGQGTNWLPTGASLDGKAAALRRDESGALWLALPAGVSQLVLEADAGNAAAVDISLPLPVRDLKSDLKGWSLSGLDARGLPSGALMLAREQGASGKDDARGTQRDALAPLVGIERRLVLGLHWSVETVIRRSAPSRAPVRVSYALLAGETVDDAGVHVEGGKVSVQLGGEDELVVRSSLKQAPALKLVASASPHQVETWTLDASGQWHVGLDGIAPIAHYRSDRWSPVWQPWPGESVGLAVVKPGGVAGQTLTIDRVNTTVTPGLRASDYDSEIALRASLGGNHRIALPKGAELLGVTIDGAKLALQAQDGELSLPIAPGFHQIALRWRLPEGMSAWLRNAPLRLNSAGVNDTLAIAVPQDHMVLAAGGPRVGPAVLIWGPLLAIALLAPLFARLRALPLGARGWLLLGVGLAPVSLGGLALVVGWFLALQLRARFHASLARWQLIALQLLLIVATIGVVMVLLATLRVGLLGHPDLGIAGNGSNASHLAWYVDRFAGTTAEAWVLAMPIWVYRAVMLLWALWLASALLRWVRWAWDCASAGGLWPVKPVVVTETTATAD